MKIKIVLLLLFFGFIVSGEVLQACQLSAASYKGESSRKLKTYLTLKKVPGRKGSFYALLRIQNKNKKKGSYARLYMVDKEKKATCLMYRLRSSEDGYLKKEKKVLMP